MKYASGLFYTTRGECEMYPINIIANNTEIKPKIFTDVIVNDNVVTAEHQMNKFIGPECDMTLKILDLKFSSTFDQNNRIVINSIFMLYKEVK